jgi:hypothetical protein
MEVLVLAEHIQVTAAAMAEMLVLACMEAAVREDTLVMVEMVEAVDVSMAPLELAELAVAEVLVEAAA